MRQNILDTTVNSLQMTALLSNLSHQFNLRDPGKCVISRIEATIQARATFLVLFPAQDMENQAAGYPALLDKDSLVKQRDEQSRYLTQVHAALLQALKKLNFAQLGFVAKGGRTRYLCTSRPSLEQAHELAQYVAAVPLPKRQEAAWEMLFRRVVNDDARAHGSQVVHKLASLRKNSLAAWHQLFLDLGCCPRTAKKVAKEVHLRTSSHQGTKQVDALMKELVTCPSQLAKMEVEKPEACASPSGKKSDMEKVLKPIESSMPTLSPVWEKTNAYEFSLKLNHEVILSSPGFKKRYARLISSIEPTDLKTKKELLEAMATAFSRHSCRAPEKVTAVAKRVLYALEAKFDELQKRVDQQKKQEAEEEVQALKALRDMGPLLKVLKANPNLVEKALNEQAK